MQPKHLPIVLILCISIVVFVYVHFGDEVSRLEATNKKLEQAIEQMQLSSGIDQQQLHAKNTVLSGDVATLATLRSSLTVHPSEDPSNDLVLIYNRVPKTGSTSFMGVAYDLCAKNKSRFTYNVSSWSEKKPALYHGHIAYLDFERFGIAQKPIFINIIRKPLDRLISYYYFLRYGDDFRPYLVRKRQGDKMTFDECVLRQELDCAEENMWMQIPFFCGHVADCWVPGNEWALQQAKLNLVNKYLLVGVTEELQDFVALLEATLPRFFKGSLNLFLNGKKSHLRKTTIKLEPSVKTIETIHKSPIWKMENDFYQFALDHFHFMKKRTLTVRGGIVTDKGQQFLYEKIRPK
uniref:Sulfotransferase domain-containing protein n=1 Tax=Strigamia maritima TaxID=126957 RepID=T1IUR6_STRMM